MVSATNTPHNLESFAGGKGRSLAELTEKGFHVPHWSVIGTDVLDRLMENIRADIDLLLGALCTDNVASTHESIAALLAGMKIDDPAESAIARAYREAGCGRVAVRSSGVDEDGSQMSFAGQFTTRLNVSGLDAVRDAVRDCWASAFSARSLAYRVQHCAATGTPGMAVVVQEMVDADLSGVLFTANPLSGNRDECVISSVYGLGEGLVSGAIDADTVVLDKATGAVVATVVGDKSERLDAGDGPGYVVSAVDQELRDALSVGPGLLADLHAVAVLAEAAFAAPQDIEWAVAGDHLWILQSRPITSKLADPGAGTPRPDGEHRVWDNSNIIESFSGVTSPLTYSFAADAYATVYRNYARALRVPRAQLRQMDDWLPVMLGYFHGRVYYNLLHWYRMVRLAPVYPLTRRVLEVSLGVAEPLSDEVADSLYPFTFRTGLGRRFCRTVATLEFARRFLFMERSVSRFADQFDVAHRVFDGVDYDALPGDEVHRRFRDLKRDLLEKWGPMMAVDAAILLSFGAMHLLTRKWLPGAPEWFTGAVVAPGAGIESAKPAYALRRIAETVRADPVAHEIITGTPPDRIRQALLDAGRTRVVADTDAYVAAYGYRSPDELKLEVPDLREQPDTVFGMVRAALPEGAERSGDPAQSYLDDRLRGPRRWVYERVRRKTKKLLADRELVRFCRTRAFGSAKRMLRAMGRDLARMGALADWRDVFMLRIEEVTGAFDGTISHTELPELVALRRRILASDESLHAPSRFTTNGTPYWRGNLTAAGWSADAGPRAGAREFHGTPCCPGVVVAKAVVTATPAEAGGGILVAYRTDPGWVSALASAAGLIIERGSPLTHVAIIARELGIPTVVQVKDVTRELRTGMLVRLDGATGSVVVLDDSAQPVAEAVR